LLKKVTKEQEISLGVGFQGPVVWNWTQTPHILTAGATGAGKSSLVRWMMAVLVRAGYPVYLVDPKNAVDFFFAVDLLAGPVATNAEQAIPVLDKLWAEHEQRTKQLREVRCASLTEAHAIGKLLDLTQIFCFVDELAVFQLNSKYKATKEAGAYCVTRLEQLALAARATGISLFLASQYPKSDILPSAIKQQAHKICFRVEDSVASEMILDARGAETLSPITPGRALSRVGTELEEWQAYYFTTEHLDQWLHFKIKGEELN
jgi:S-DNA-T family DNA segregation ATPase FtsK/SpoIIIE